MSENNTQSILLIEDDKNLGPVIQEVLEMNNYKVTLVDDSIKGLNELGNNNYDLIILDEMLPKMTGIQTIIKIRADHSIANMPILMITSITNKDHELEALESGADDYINKPFRLSILLARIKTLLKRNYKTSFNIDIPADADPISISIKEKEVLYLIAQGYNNSRISKELFISEHTVATHLKNIYMKLKVENRTQAAIIALKLNII